MYRVRMESKQEGRKKIVRKESFDKFMTEEEAHEFIDGVITQQEQICWKSWGLLMTNRIMQDDGKLRVEYNPACTIFASLTQLYEVISA